MAREREEGNGMKKENESNKIINEMEQLQRESAQNYDDDDDATELLIHSQQPTNPSFVD
jgi:hypothetical protein